MALPVSLKLEEKLVCSICLELFRVPVTLPCGHNFCKRCISDHWHKQEQAPARAEKGYRCPECRRGFEQHPDLEKNVTLCSVVELARDGEARVSGTERREVAHGELCPQHGRPLELYCEDERRCICCVCTVRQCQQHRRVLFEEERSKKQVGMMGGGVAGRGRGSRGSLGTARHPPALSCALLRGCDVSLCAELCPASAERGAGTGTVEGDATSTHLLPKKPGTVRSSRELGKSSSTR